MNIVIEPSIQENGHILYQRRLTFPDGMELKTTGDSKCILSKHDFAFLKKYKINVRADKILPSIMFFGDTSSRVFKNRRVMELIRISETVIIESTFLESEQELGPKEYKEHKKKRHMFLHELVPVMTMNPQTEFLLIHFSARYKKSEILSRIQQTGCSNAVAFL